MMSWEISEDEERASFEVVRVDDLPSVDRDDIPIVPSGERPCGCYWCKWDWQAIADAAVAIFEGGVDPLDHEAIWARAEQAGLDAESGLLLLTLFTPTQAIIVLRGSGQFTNGMHRTHALRMAGAERCVVYTGRGELPYDERRARRRPLDAAP
jgi:hypothetical protein